MSDSPSSGVSAIADSAVSYGRQTDILDPFDAQATHVTICGLGTVGSHAAVELARMGVGSLHLIDGDVVESHNLPSQAFEVTDLGRPKTEALIDRVNAVSDRIEITETNAMLSGGESFADGPVIMAVDSMDARKAILDMSIAYRPNHPLVIDGRMGGKTLQLFAFDPSDSAKLDTWTKNFWFPQDKAREIPCGGRSVSFVGSYIGGLIASYICRQINGEAVPFMLQTDLDSFTTVKID